MGLGGGAFLIVYLTVFAGMGQLEAQGINLLFFLPIAAASIFFHAKKGLIEWKAAFPAAAAGVVGAVLSSWLVRTADPGFLPKVFGAFILLSGMSGLFFSCKNEKKRRK